MANKKIENKDLIADNLLQPTIKEFEELLKVVNLTQTAFEELLKQSIKNAKSKPFDSYANLKDIAGGIEDVDKAVEGLTKAEKERLKLEQQLKTLRTEQAKDNEIIKQQIVAERRQLREQAKERAGLLSQYQQESKRLNDLRKQYKELAIAEKENTKEGKALLKNIQALDKRLKEIDDSVGQNQRSVGKYTDALKKLDGTLGKIAGASVVLKVLEGFASAFQSNSRTGAELEKLFGRLTVTISVLVSRFADGIPVLKSLFSDFVNGIKRDVLEFQLSFAKAPLIGNDERAKEIQKELDALAKDSGKSLSDLSKSFEGVGDEIAKTVAKNDKLIDTTLAYRLEIAELVKQQSKLLEEEAKLEVASGDNTISLEERKTATEELLLVQQNLNNLEIKIAQKELDLANQRVSTFKDDIGAREEVAQATLALETAKAKAVTDTANATKEARDIESDIIERNLDFLIDDFDRRKTINERIIADETFTFAERRALLVETRRLNEQAFKDQQEEINELAKTKLDFDKLVTMTDSKEIAGIIAKSGLSDRLAGRALEIIKERIQFNQDLFESERDLDKVESDSNLTKEESILLEEALIKSKKKGADLDAILLELSEKTLQSEIDNLNLKIALLKKGSESEIEAQKELNAKLLEQQQNKADKEESIEAKKQERLAELAQLGVDSVQQFAQKSFDNTTANIDREISALEQRESTLRALAEKGVENVENNLAIEQKKRAELEAKRAQAVRRQQNIELGLSVLETYSNKVSQGDKNALGSTIADTSLLLSFISSLPAFYEGAERVGDELSPALSGKDGHIVRVDGDERILNPTHSKMIPKNISNLELATMAQMSSKGLAPARKQDNSEVVKELRELKTAIENKPVYDFKYDDVKKAVADVVESKGRRETNWRRNSDFF